MKNQRVNLVSTHLRGRLNVVLAELSGVKQQLGDSERVRQILANEIVAKNREITTLQQLSTVDTLTGLLNRRGMEAGVADAVNTLSHQVRETDEQRHLPQVGMVLIDIDHFGLFNKEHGIRTGDQVLRTLSERLQQGLQLRESDFICRYGGEELAVFLISTDEVTTHRKAEQVVTLINSLPFQTATGKEVTVTVSAGAATIQIQPKAKADEVFKALTDRADQALRLAKKNGRNQVVAHY